MHNRSAAPLVFVLCASMTLADNGAQPTKVKPAPKQVQPPAREPPEQPGKKHERQEITLKVRDPAPPISVSKWVKGDAVPDFQGGRVYVVEFWATWCPPSVKRIADLTSLQHQHKNLTVIGVASFEKLEQLKASKNDEDQKPAEGDPLLAHVEEFVNRQGTRMNYTVAYDSSGVMKATWFNAAGLKGFPAAFVVDGGGQVAWIGVLSGDKEKEFKEAVETACKTAPPMRKKDAKEKDDAPANMKDGRKKR
jgi:thiol-disulfide isomerase/thioredoxin